MNTKNVEPAVITSVFIRGSLILVLLSQLLACNLLDGAASLVGESSRDARNDTEGDLIICSRGSTHINKYKLRV